MNFDHHFEIGKTHKVCEDYALSGQTSYLTYGIITDGCSSARPDVDFGARALALSARRTLMLNNQFDYNLFGKITIHNLEHIADIVPISSRALDATLIVSMVKENGDFTVYFYGDGVLVHQSKSDVNIVSIDYESNAPSYLSYYLDKVRLKEYNERVTGSKVITDITLFKDIAGFKKETLEADEYVDNFVPAIFNGHLEHGDSLSIMSDGIKTFNHAEGNEVKWLDSVLQMTNFKTTEGVFVQRRMQAMKRQMMKDNTYHSDDISMATIVV